MCYHIRQTKKAVELEQRFHAKMTDADLFTPSEHTNGFDFKKTPVITHSNRGEIQLYNWGLIPYWSKDKTIRAQTLNAKIETINEKPSFRDAVKNRCLVLVDGFYEWQWLDAKGKQKQKYLITLPDNSAFAFAGIYSHWKDYSTGEKIDSYAIVTTEANKLMAEIHNTKKRMPLILHPELEKEWLEGIEVDSFKACDPELIATPTETVPVKPTNQAPTLF